MERTEEAGRTADETGYRVDDLTIDLGRRCVSRGETVIPLAELSFDFLVALARAAPNLLTFDQLTERVWPGLVISPETITQRAKVVRDALGDDARSPRYFAGVRGRGYRMLATVTQLDTPAPARSMEAQERGVNRILSLKAPTSRSSIAVLPFANLTGDPGKEYFSDGMAEELFMCSRGCLA